jgi:hypothetical protein
VNPYHDPFADGGDPWTLSHCSELRELEAFVMFANDAELDLISSITSTKIEKITLAHSPAFELPADDTYWTRLDDILVKLAERSTHPPGLEVEFLRVRCWDERPKSDLAEYLPKFVEVGWVMVLDWEGNLICSSDGARGGR